MAVLGLYCGDDLLAQEMEEMVTALCMGVGYGRKAAREADYELRRIPSLSELEEEVMAGDEMFYLILAGEKPEKAFAAAERLWEESPSLSIILVVSEAEDVFSALSYPFFLSGEAVCAGAGFRGRVPENGEEPSPGDTVAHVFM